MALKSGLAVARTAISKVCLSSIDHPCPAPLDGEPAVEVFFSFLGFGGGVDGLAGRMYGFESTSGWAEDALGMMSNSREGSV